jgi:diacylglycerol kinase family enzyme
MALHQTPDPSASFIPKVRIRRVEAIVNPLSGGVGPGAADALQRILAQYGFAVRVCEAEGKDLPPAVRAAVDAGPDVIIVLAGDGTAAMAARRAGAHGPLVMPLPGGTMNMLPHAIYGALGWEQALALGLDKGSPRSVSGGLVEGRPFYVGAIMGAPALWARAREAIRKGRLDLALSRARHAVGRAFTGSLHYRIAGGPHGRAEALALFCPLVSRTMHAEEAFEVAAMDVKNAGDAFRLGVRYLTSDWRKDPAVVLHEARQVKASARGSIPAILDGESFRLPRHTTVDFVPEAFRTLAPPPPSAEGC